jgi:hypothetical protein
MAPSRTTLLGGALLVALFPGQRPGAAAPPASESDPLFLMREGRLTESERRGLDRGEIVTKIMEPANASEVLAFAALRVKTTPSRVLDRFRSGGQCRGDPFVLGTGMLSAIPSVRDLEGLTLDAGDVRDLSKCRIHDCEVRLPAETIQLFRTAIDWTSPQHAADATELFRRTLVSYSLSYLRQGNPALFEYANNDDPVRIGEGLKGLILRSGFLREAEPDLYAYLEQFPNRRPREAEDFVFWLKETFWRRDVLSLNHSTVIDHPTPSGRLIIAAARQLYATRYYETALNITTYVETPGGAAYLVSLNRARADIRPSGFNWIERLLLNRLVRGRIETQSAHVKRWLEGT